MRILVPAVSDPDAFGRENPLLRRDFCPSLWTPKSRIENLDLTPGNSVWKGDNFQPPLNNHRRETGLGGIKFTLFHSGNGS